MQDYRVAERYAKSLFDLAKEKGALEGVYADMLQFNEVFKANRDLRIALSNPIIDNFKKASILKSIFEGKFNGITTAMFELLAKKNRQDTLGALAEEFIRIYRASTGVVEATVISAVPLTDTQKQKLNAYVSSKTKMNVIFNEQIDGSLIGGFILRMPGLELNTSLKSKIEALKLSLIDNSYVDKI